MFGSNSPERQGVATGRGGPSPAESFVSPAHKYVSSLLTIFWVAWPVWPPWNGLRLEHFQNPGRVIFQNILLYLSLSIFKRLVNVWFQFSWTARCGHRTRGTIASRILHFSCTQLCFISSHYILGCFTFAATMKWITFRTPPEPWPCWEVTSPGNALWSTVLSSSGASRLPNYRK